jgi:hypothetical protein
MNQLQGDSKGRYILAFRPYICPAGAANGTGLYDRHSAEVERIVI